MSFIRIVLLTSIFLNGIIGLCFMSINNLTETKNVTREKNTRSGESRKLEETFVCKKASDCKNNTECENNVCIPKCNHTSDCDDPRMTCKNGLCVCSRFHYRMQSIECIPNVSRIMFWLKKSSSLESEAESQGSAFEIKQEEPYPIWAEYQGAREVGLGFIPKPVWPVVICTGLLLLVYSLILYDVI